MTITNLLLEEREREREREREKLNKEIINTCTLLYLIKEILNNLFPIDSEIHFRMELYPIHRISHVMHSCYEATRPTYCLQTIRNLKIKIEIILLKIILLQRAIVHVFMYMYVQ